MIAFIVFMTSSAFTAVADYVFNDVEWWMGASWIFDALIAIIAGATWCHLDARIGGHLISRRLALWIVLAAGIAIPVYLVQSRGWKGALKLGLGIPFMAVSFWLYDPAWDVTGWVCERMGWLQ